MKNVNREILDVYNINGDAQNRTVYRGGTLNDGDYYLVVQIWIKNSSGEFLIQKRADSLKSGPGIWATTAGAVKAGENSLTGAVRELQEELGLKVFAHELQKLGESVGTVTLGTAWLLERDVALHEISICAEEVSQIMWASPEKIRKMVEEGTFYDYGNEYFRNVFSRGKLI